MVKIVKKLLLKGIIRGIAISNLEGCSFIIKLEDKIEGLPEEFVVYSRKAAHRYSPVSREPKIQSTHIREGDYVIIEGQIVQEVIGKENFEIIRMEAEHIYNITLKCGF
ncbi:MAG: hypothetical protein ACFFCM_11625 [Promethearchaeota archaeon]